MPEVEAHAERLERQFGGRILAKFTPFNFTELKTAAPAPNEAYGLPLLGVGRRGKYLILRFDPISFVIHLMQGGRLLADEKRSAKPRGGQARFTFEPVDIPPTDDRPGSTDGSSPNRARSDAPVCGAFRLPNSKLRPRSRSSAPRQQV